MATKSDLIEAQNFSRRRLLTAFVSGAPEGKELEPAAPLRAVIVAVALTAAVILAGVFYGLIQPGLPDGWQNGKMIVAKDTGARYVSINGTLHPVLNTASARLLIPSSSFSIITTTQQNLQNIPLGASIGIVGAPDQLPAPSQLISSGWTACVADSGGLDVEVITSPGATATTSAALVSNGDRRFVIAGASSYEVTGDAGDAVLRAAGISAVTPSAVPAAWLNLFTPGTPLAPITVSGAGAPVTGTQLHTGDVVHVQGTADDARYLVTAQGRLAELSPLAWQLYQIGSGAAGANPITVPASTVSGLPTSDKPVGGADWPHDGFTPMARSERPCALLVKDASGSQTVLASRDGSAATTAQVAVESGHGALVSAAGRGNQSSGMVTLIDATGTAYPLPGASDETIKRLGYMPADVTTITNAWIPLFSTGPVLSTSAAGLAADGSSLAPSPSAAPPGG